jgi:hypothetical protein
MQHSSLIMVVVYSSSRHADIFPGIKIENVFNWVKLRVSAIFKVLCSSLRTLCLDLIHLRRHGYLFDDAQVLSSLEIKSDFRSPVYAYGGPSLLELNYP